MSLDVLPFPAISLKVLKTKPENSQFLAYVLKVPKDLAISGKKAVHKRSTPALKPEKKDMTPLIPLYLKKIARKSGKKTTGNSLVKNEKEKTKPEQRPKTLAGGLR